MSRGVHGAMIRISERAFSKPCKCYFGPTNQPIPKQANIRRNPKGFRVMTPITPKASPTIHKKTSQASHFSSGVLFWRAASAPSGGFRGVSGAYNTDSRAESNERCNFFALPLDFLVYLWYLDNRTSRTYQRENAQRTRKNAQKRFDSQATVPYVP